MGSTAGYRWRLQPWLVPALLVALTPQARAADEVRVAVVAILANGDSKKIDPAVADIAKHVKHKYPMLTGFRLCCMTSQSVTVGEENTFPLADDQSAQIVVQQVSDKNDRVRIKVKPPQLGEITYTTCCGKYFPIVTPYLTKGKQEQLILAIMVTTCK